ncbi:TetR/AcrR family transcriptional regulator [Desulfosporosinus orientis]|uniref:TetR/AcrR family transcriptional regulator n=1 Tax=Desulfosporosinus orientis TaxID=1563 RepID=UPI000693E054|nr:TetR/AcrR family transcriptional regulator [Desulfosporosinus orientis]
MKNDMRVIRTKRAIRQAFLTLLTEKKYENITVQDIAREAFINRNTFYTHYIDKTDLLEKLSNECLDDLKKCLAEKNIPELDDDLLYTIIKDVLNTIEMNAGFYRSMMIDSDSAFFTEKLATTLKDIVYPYISDSTGQEKDLFIEYLISGFIGIIRMYLKGDIKVSIEKLSNFFFNFIHQNPYSLFLKNT